MAFVSDRFNYLFKTSKGLILVAIAMISLVTAVWGMLSGPMAELGTRTWLVERLGMDLVQAEREGRIVILYHAIAMAVGVNQIRDRLLGQLRDLLPPVTGIGGQQRRVHADHTNRRDNCADGAAAITGFNIDIGGEFIHESFALF